MQSKIYFFEIYNPYLPGKNLIMTSTLKFFYKFLLLMYEQKLETSLSKI